MKNLIVFSVTLLMAIRVCAQSGSIKTEQYQADFEKKMSLDSLPEYSDTIKIPIQILKIGFTEDLYEMYPELKDKRIGLGVTNIVLEYLEYTNRFVFTEDKLEIKEKMITQFKASDKGFTENKIDGRGKVKLAKYFVYIEIYDFSVSEIKEDYFDPNLVDNTKNQVDAKKKSVVSYGSKVNALSNQIQAIENEKRLKLQQAENKIKQAIEKIG